MPLIHLSDPERQQDLKGRTTNAEGQRHRHENRRMRIEE